MILPVDHGRHRVQWFGHLLGHALSQVPVDEAIQLARPVEHSHLQWKVEANCGSIRAAQLDSIRLETPLQL